MPTRAVESERQGELSANAQADDHLGTGERPVRRASVAALSQARVAEKSEVAVPRRPLAEVGRVTRLEEHIRRVVDAAPPLTDEQHHRLTLLLRGMEPDLRAHHRSR
jgi:hypothetical protein